ncbi:hypothetical protein M011DRAFT_510141 [Sporormia fimetaria CBS 119925]|uniref:BTB domain-containing protein n=1 Tax=Sporormia fimetaria CBS 119925 TaxID=1340428 RepID=A0A6A6VIQ8_9PLEO|nr:hypothetical protein M011DRAFT_510141 [Sporormia fimetaria CBS 119925]
MNANYTSRFALPNARDTARQVPSSPRVVCTSDAVRFDKASVMRIFVRSDDPQVKEEEFIVDGTVLTLRSEFFRTAMNGNWAESKSRKVTLSGVEPETFRNYLNLVCLNSIPVQEERSRRSKEYNKESKDDNEKGQKQIKESKRTLREVEERIKEKKEQEEEIKKQEAEASDRVAEKLIDMYVLAERILDTKAKDSIIACLSRGPEIGPVTHHPSGHVISKLYKGTMYGDNCRKLLFAYHICYKDRPDYHFYDMHERVEEYPPDYMSDLIKILFNGSLYFARLTRLVTRWHHLPDRGDASDDAEDQYYRMGAELGTLDTTLAVRYTGINRRIG